ncbi:tripartite tricarboxylate transporter substrate binding protein [Roseomonas nepalensis]|uniref:Tripartite tricarboxylate transporter substrate binding protein n=1 Tax=Muricoccus nepalensis TaxID=1854500 RepID=A0A502GBY3_9PROT|nr:tripartite tricarboxylate transporter substrate binding protein [Roseomonas nepalensis]TPG59777.1 tripartite tricarboxylate transporter substrate binding protein [Roseomonas nepalensis]
MPSRRRLAAALLPLAIGSRARAQAPSAFPSHPVRVVVPFPPGGTADVLVRLLQPPVAERLGQPLVIENRAGGATIIGTDAVAKAAADGYALLLVANSFAINATLVAHPPFDARRDFTGVASLGFNPHVLVVNNAFPARTVAELVAAARAAPGRLSYASFGNGTSAHLGGESFKQAAGLELQHVPYRGGAPALQDVMGGQVPMMFNNLPDTLPLIRDGRVRAIAVAGARRAVVLPEVPTFAESGLPGVVSNSWFGLVARAGTPAGILDRLHDAVTATLAEPAVAARFGELGVEPRPMPRAAFDAFLRDEFDRNAALIRRAGITAD